MKKFLKVVALGAAAAIAASTMIVSNVSAAGAKFKAVVVNDPAINDGKGAIKFYNLQEIDNMEGDGVDTFMVKVNGVQDPPKFGAPKESPAFSDSDVGEGAKLGGLVKQNSKGLFAFGYAAKPTDEGGAKVAANTWMVVLNALEPLTIEQLESIEILDENGGANSQITVEYDITDPADSSSDAQSGDSSSEEPTNGTAPSGQVPTGGGTAPTGTLAPQGSNAASSSTTTTPGGNPKTGVALALIPTLIAAGAAGLVSRKKK